LLALVVTAFAGLVVFTARPILLPPTNSRITKANCDRIMPGMSRADVEAIFGPPGDFRTLPVSTEHPGEDDDIAPHGKVALWRGNDGCAVVAFDAEKDVAIGAWFAMTRTRREGVWELIRWRWNRWRGSRP
jgi:hypothetical protein